MYLAPIVFPVTAKCVLFHEKFLYLLGVLTGARIQVSLTFSVHPDLSVCCIHSTSKFQKFSENILFTFVLQNLFCNNFPLYTSISLWKLILDSAIYGCILNMPILEVDVISHLKVCNLDARAI